MQATTPPLPVAVKSRRRWRLIGGFALLLIATPFAYHFVAGWLRDRELDEIYRELDAEDPHWRWPDLVAQNPASPPDERNAAVQVLKVCDLLKKTPFIPAALAKKGKKQIPDHRNARLRKEDEQLLRAALSKLDVHVLDEARKLKDMPRGSLAIIPSENPFEMDDPRAQEKVAVMRLLQHDAMLRGQDGDLNGAAESCRALLHAAASNDFPTFMTQLIRAAGQEFAVDALERTLGQGDLGFKHLDQLQAGLALEAECQGMYHSMRGERAFLHQVYLLYRDGKITDSKWIDAMNLNNPIPKPFRYLFANPFIRDYPETLRLWSELVRATKLPDEAQVDALPKLEQKLNTNSTAWAGYKHILAVAKDLKTPQARLRCAIAAVAAERYRLMHNNTWPRGLDDLVKEGLLKEVPKDPYDGKPLRFKRTPTGVIVYSVGPDMIDNGGKLAPANPRAAGTDIGFELWDRRGVPPPAGEETP
jgi:hypothetical protein